MPSHKTPNLVGPAQRNGRAPESAAGRSGAGPATATARLAVVGYGCHLRGDDAIGLLVAEEMQRGVLPPGVEIRSLDRDGTALLDAWEGCELAVVIDAAVTGAPAGTLHRFDGKRLPPPAALRLSSSHEIGLREAIELGATLGRLPDRLVILGIEARAFEPGAPLTREVEAALPAAHTAVLRELGIL
jgi:hydrogenase maturation protease